MSETDITTKNINLSLEEILRVYKATASLASLAQGLDPVNQSMETIIEVSKELNTLNEIVHEAVKSGEDFGKIDKAIVDEAKMLNTLYKHLLPSETLDRIKAYNTELEGLPAKAEAEATKRAEDKANEPVSKQLAKLYKLKRNRK